MKHLIITTILLSLFMSSAKAQFFSFGDPFSFGPNRQAEQVKVSPPKYKGGSEGVNKFIQKEFRLLEGKSGKEGQIVVVCIIDEKGKVSETQVTRGIDREMNDEAVRVVKKMKFKPATQGKKKVKYQYSVVFPIRWGKVSFINIPTVTV